MCYINLHLAQAFGPTRRHIYIYIYQSYHDHPTHPHVLEVWAPTYRATHVSFNPNPNATLNPHATFKHKCNPNVALYGSGALSQWAMALAHSQVHRGDLTSLIHGCCPSALRRPWLKGKTRWGKREKGRGRTRIWARIPLYNQTTRTHARTETEIDFPVGPLRSSPQPPIYIYIYIHR